MPVAGRTVALIYAVLAYTSFVVVAVWAVLFLANVGPTSVDRGHAGSGWWAVDVGLLLIFAVQHSVLARASVKRFMALPVSVERSTYVVATVVALGSLFGWWRPDPTTIWHVTVQPWSTLIWIGYAAGWAIAIGSTFLVDHLHFLGIRQASGSRAEPPFRIGGLYALVRHPMMLGLVIAFWVTPRMTAGHALFAAAGTAYIAVGVWFEERDLRGRWGETYREYARRVPAVIPAVRFPRCIRS